MNSGGSCVLARPETRGIECQTGHRRGIYCNRRTGSEPAQDLESEDMSEVDILDPRSLIMDGESSSDLKLALVIHNFFTRKQIY